MRDVITRIEGRVGRISLNRAKVLHALNAEMCELIVDSLRRWQHDPDIAMVIVDHGEGRGFCAGGDIRMLAESGAGDGVEGRAFFHIEYQMNHLMFTYAKPLVVFMDGVTMGGGVGLSLPCQFRVATERTIFAMPETGIGLFPDVGGGWYLSRLEGRAGYWLALTGARLAGADCLVLGLATHFLPSDGLEQVKQALVEGPENVKAILHAAAQEPLGLFFPDKQAEIDRLFADDQIELILAALAADASDWAQEQLRILQTKSPQSCKVALRQLAESRKLSSFGENMKMEYAIACRIIQSHDFREGVRAVIIDKDNAPKWRPSSPYDVSEAQIGYILAPLPIHEEWEPL